MGCNFACLDPDYLNQPLEVRIDEKTYEFTKRPKDLRSLYEKLQDSEETTTSRGLVFEYSSNDGIKKLLNDLLLHEAYIMHGDKKLVIGARTSFG